MRKIIEFGLLAILIYTPLIHATKGIATLTATYILILTLTCLWLLKMNPVRGNPAPLGEGKNEYKKVRGAPTSVGTSNGVNWQGRVKFIKTPLNLPLAIFFFLALFSTFSSINREASFGELYKVITFILLYFLLINHIREEYHLKAIILTILGVGSIVAGYGVYQYFSHWPNLTEIASTFPPNPNSLAGYLLLIIPLAFALALWSSSKWLSRLAFLTASLAFISLLATHSRGGYLAFMGSVVIFILLARKRVMERKRRLFFLLGMLLFITASLITIQIILKPQPLEKAAEFLTELKPYSPAQVILQEPSAVSLGEPISTRFFTWQRTPANKFIVDRLQIWGRTLEIIRDYPFLGTGMGTYGIIFKRHKIPIPLTSETIARYGLSANFAHNEYLQIAAETGLPSLIIFLWIITLIFRTGLRTLTKVTQLSSYPVNQLKTNQPTNRQTGKLENWQNCLIIGLLSGLTGLLLHSFVDFVLRPPATDILFIYFAAFIMLQAKRGDQLTSQPTNGLTGSTDITGSTGITGQPYPTDTVLSHLYRSPLIRGSLIIGLTLVLITQVTIPLLAHWRYQRGLNYEKKKSFDRAILEYHMALKLLPSNAHYHTTFGNIYQRLSLQLPKERKSWLTEAVSEYEKAVSLSPMDSHYRKDLGIAYWLASEGKNKVLINEALSQFRESLRIDPTFPFSHASLGVIYAKLGLKDRAIEEFSQAIYYEPNYAESHYNLAMLYLKKGSFEKAVDELHQTIKIKDRDLFGKVSCGYENALLTFDYGLAHLQLAALYEKIGKKNNARIEYEKALSLHPQNPYIKEALTRLKKE